MGRAGIDLYADQIGAPLEEVTSFSKYVGGCPANIAVGTARLGLRSGMLTRVGDDGLGRFVRNFLQAEGVDVGRVLTDPERRTGLVILGIEPPDRFPLLFYRENCADIHLGTADVEGTEVGATRALVVSGTGLSREPSRSATRRAMALARAAGTRVVLDLDVREVLWPEGRDGIARELRAAVPQADLVVGTEEEMASAGGVGDVRVRASGLVVVKRGPRGATALPSGGAPVEAPGFCVTILNTLGAGDGFLSGFLVGWLSGSPTFECLRLGNAAGAIVVTRHGCAPAMPRRDEVMAFMAQRSPVDP
jgi:5-dehydro-2-deoxygluconokinase